ncbi:MAG: hypothetical protein A2512_05595 [Deltaproteobacteria bacterium RIFOXYD12_FULL_56_24]|nr:MAG: hypothetical protein A2512_05595 [Deltaproteobacteria bacterium RIFOXYD12_FULL_56_24]
MSNENDAGYKALPVFQGAAGTGNSFLSLWLIILNYSEASKVSPGIVWECLFVVLQTAGVGRQPQALLRFRLCGGKNDMGGEEFFV